MQIIGRECGGCRAAIVKMGDADGCGACDLVLCRTCLGGTERCPSCQRRFDDVRDESAKATLMAEGARFAQGRQQALAISFSLVGSVALLLLIGALPAPTALVGLGVLALLSYQLLRGSPWSRWGLVILVSYYGVFGHGVQAYHRMSDEAPRWPIHAGLLLVYALCVVVLVTSRPLAHYMRVARAKVT